MMSSGTKGVAAAAFCCATGLRGMEHTRRRMGWAAAAAAALSGRGPWTCCCRGCTQNASREESEPYDLARANVGTSIWLFGCERITRGPAGSGRWGAGAQMGGPSPGVRGPAGSSKTLRLSLSTHVLIASVPTLVTVFGGGVIKRAPGIRR